MWCWHQQRASCWSPWSHLAPRGTLNSFFFILVGCWKSAQELKAAGEQRGQQGQPDSQRVALVSPCWSTPGCKGFRNSSQTWAGTGQSNLCSQHSEAERGLRRVSLAGNYLEQSPEPVKGDVQAAAACGHWQMMNAAC